MLSLLLVVSLIGSAGCGSVEKKPSESPSLPKGEALTILDEDCQPIVGMPEWVCHHAEERYIRLGKIVIKLEGTVDDQAKEITYLQEKRKIIEDQYEARLDQWHRKWHITMPTGGAITLAIVLLLMLL